MNENPYKSPQVQLPVVRRPTPNVFRMMFSGLVVGTLVGLGAGAVAGAALFISLWVLATITYSSPDPIAVAEFGAMQVFRGVFTGSIVGFAIVTPLGAVLGAVAAFWQPLSKRAFVLLATILHTACFAIVGTCVPSWPSPFSAFVTGVVGIGGGVMLGRVLAEMASFELNRTTARGR
jgi:hypothetical protein